MNQSREEKNKAIVVEAFDTLFSKRDYERALKFWSDKYLQHSSENRSQPPPE
jgi:predicted SnoaL-like aldol condensation-catalyzing enzyme